MFNDVGEIFILRSKLVGEQFACKNIGEVRDDEL